VVLRYPEKIKIQTEKERKQHDIDQFSRLTDLSYAIMVRTSIIGIPSDYNEPSIL
jgi:hypothetical protein